MKFRLLVALCVFAPIAHGRLGDTRDQAEARYGLPKGEKPPKYGRPLLEGARELTFHYEGYQIRCALLPATDGREYTVREEYTKLTRNTVIQDFEMEAILEGERNGQQWGLRKNTLNLGQGLEKALQSQFTQALAGKVWVRPDGATAGRTLGSATVKLELSQAAKYEAELKSIKEREARKSVPKF